MSFILGSMISEPVRVGSAPLETEEEKAILYARRCYALACFLLSCFWLVVVTVLLFLSGFSVAHVSDSVLIAAIATIPALFVIFMFFFPSAPARPHFAYVERDQATGKDRLVD